jgi:hypothetical protein
MPLYFFSMEDGERITAEEPEELPNNQAAKEHAQAVASELTRGNASTVSVYYGWIVVENEADEVVARVPMGENRR